MWHGDLLTCIPQCTAPSDLSIYQERDLDLTQVHLQQLDQAYNLTLGGFAFFQVNFLMSCFFSIAVKIASTFYYDAA